MNWIAAHLAPLLGGATLAAGAAAWVLSKGKSAVESAVAALDGKALSAVKNPKVKAFLIKVETAVLELVPDAGDARYAAATDLLIAEWPVIAPARSVILAVLTVLGAGLKAGEQDAIAQQDKPAA